jgi:hypothetical protein
VRPSVAEEAANALAEVAVDGAAAGAKRSQLGW